MNSQGMSGFGLLATQVANNGRNSHMFGFNVSANIKLIEKVFVTEMTIESTVGIITRIILKNELIKGLWLQLN